jgi:hypothetical protein
MAEWDPELILNQWRDTVSAIEENTPPMSWGEIENLRADLRQSRGVVSMQLEDGDPAHGEEVLAEFEFLEKELEASIARSVSIHGQPRRPGLSRFSGLFKGLLSPIKKILP